MIVQSVHAVVGIEWFDVLVTRIQEHVTIAEPVERLAGPTALVPVDIDPLRSQ